MTDTIISPTPERQQHDEIAVERAGRKNSARMYVVPIYDRWLADDIIDQAQRDAAHRYVQDHEQLIRGVKSCLAVLDRVDYAAAGLVTSEVVSEAQANIDAVRRSLPASTLLLVDRILLSGGKPGEVFGKHNQVSQGLLCMALDVMAKCYSLKD